MKDLNLIANVSYTGYGQVGFNILKELSKKEWNVSLFQKGRHNRTSPKEIKWIHFAEGRAEYFEYEAPCVSVWHQFDLAHRVGNGKYIAWPIFELDTFNEKERHHLNYPDELIVCSEWAKQVCESNSIDVDKIHVVPLGIDPNIFSSALYKQREKKDKTVFINAGKWEIRKGHDLLCGIFNKAFKETDNVELWMMPYTPLISKEEMAEWITMYMNSPLGRANKIKIFNWQQSSENVAEIMSNADCGVFLGRGEGFNLEALELLALGKHLIITDYSAHTEFCRKENAMLIDIDGVEPAYDGKWFFEQGNWATIGEKQIEQCVDYMREVYEKNMRPGVYVNDEGIKTGQMYTWENAAKKVEKILL